MKRDAPEDGRDVDSTAVGSDHNDTQTNKRQRIFASKAVVVDEFEREAKREVAANAGLTGTVEAGQRLELRHQVSQLLFLLQTDLYFLKGPASSCYSPWIQLRPYLAACVSCCPCTTVSFHVGPISTSRYLCY